MRDFRIKALPSEDGILINFSFAYGQGTDKRQVALCDIELDRARAKAMMLRFIQASKDVSINLASENHGGVVTSGALSMEFNAGDDEAERMNTHIRDLLLKKAGLEPA